MRRMRKRGPAQRGLLHVAWFKRAAWVSRLTLLAASVLSIAACRELTAPTQSDPTMILAQGLLLGPRNVPAASVQVKLIRKAGSSGDAFAVATSSDEEGRFQAWVPNLPLLVQVRPPTQSTLPNLDEDNVHFKRGVVRSFDLLGDMYAGVVGPARFDSLLAGAVLYMRTYVQRADGGRDGLSASTLLLPDGSFELRLPQTGRYDVYIDRCCTNAFRYYWPDSLEVSRGTPLQLEVPLVEWQLNLTLAGSPLPAGEIRCEIDDYSNTYPYDRSWQTILADGLTTKFAMYAIRGGQHFELRPYDQPVPSVPGRPGVLNFIPLFLTIPPMDDGVVLSFELGEYELQILLLDPEGVPVTGADLLLYDETHYDPCRMNANEDGRTSFFANPVGHELRVSADGYLTTRRYFTPTGDMQMTITLQPNPDEN